MIDQKNKTKYIAIIVACIFIVVLVIVGIRYNKNVSKESKVAYESGIVDDSKEAVVPIVDFENSVLVQTDDGAINKIDMASGKVVEANSLEKENFTDFVGLPELSEQQEENSEQSVLFSQDKSKAFVTITLYGDFQTSNTENQTQAVLSSDDYLCDVAQKKCQKTDLLSQSYEGLDANLQNKRSLFIWTNWNTNQNLLFGHILSENSADISPMYVCDTTVKSCKVTVGYDSQKTGDISAVVPADTLSPSLKKFAMVAQHDKPNEETGKNWELLLYNSDNLLNPQRIYDLSLIIDRDENIAYDSVFSVAWSADENKLAIGTARRIFILDLETGSLSLAYIAPLDEDGDFACDLSKIFLSPDASSIAFVDIKDILTESEEDFENEDFDETTEDTDILLNVLKKIDLKNGNTVTELLQGEGLSLK